MMFPVILGFFFQETSTFFPVSSHEPMSKHRAASEITISWDERACPASRIQCRHSTACRRTKVDRAQGVSHKNQKKTSTDSTWSSTVMGNQVIDLTKVPLIRRSGTGVADRTSHGFLELPGLCITESLQVSLLLSWVRVSNFPHLGQQLLGELSKLAHSKPCSTCRTLAPSSRWLENVSELCKWKHIWILN
jgi:hypothetical protein